MIQGVEIRIVSPELKVTTERERLDSVFIENHLIIAGDPARIPVVCWEWIVRKFVLPTPLEKAREARYWIILSNQPSKHCWPVWLKESTGTVEWQDAEAYEDSPSSVTLLSLHPYAVAVLNKYLPREKYHKGYLTVQYKEKETYGNNRRKLARRRKLGC